MNALVAAAKKEGQLNVITLPANWANYGTIMKDFTAKYGIKINDANPDGTSQDEINAVNQLKGQSRAPDVLDIGNSFAVKADQQGILAPYRVASWSDIPANSKASDGTYYADYGGYVAIGYDSAKVKTPPTSFADLLKPAYKNQVAINGNPNQAGAAFAAVYAAALANGGSFANIAPGVAYFKKLHQVGNFVPVTASAATMESGQTPVLIWWDYLLASEVGPGRPWAQDRDPVGRPLRRLLRPGHQQVRAGPGRGPAVGGVPLHDHGPEPVAGGQGPAHRTAHAAQQQHGQRDRVQGAAAGAVGDADVPDAGAAGCRREDRRGAVARRVSG